jgi:hypothetical protein
MKILMIYPQLDSPLGTNHGISAIAGVLHANAVTTALSAFLP